MAEEVRQRQVRMKTIFLVLATLMTWQAQAACTQGDESTMKVVSESGCDAGLVLLNVETVCVAKNSPALAVLEAGQDFKICARLQPDASGRTWEAVVLSATKIQ